MREFPPPPLTAEEAARPVSVIDIIAARFAASQEEASWESTSWDAPSAALAG